MNVQRIKDAYYDDLEAFIESLNITDQNIHIFIQLMYDFEFITEETHPWAFEKDDEDFE